MSNFSIKTLLASLTLAALVCRALPTWAAEGDKPFRVVGGEVAAGENAGEYKVTSPAAVLVFGAADSQNYRVDMEVRFSASPGAANLRLGTLSETDFNADAAAYITIARYEPGNQAVAMAYRRDAKGNWAVHHGISHFYAPYPKPSQELAIADGLKPGTWKDRWIPLRIELTGKSVALWMDGLLDERRDIAKPATGFCAFHLAVGDQVRNVRVAPATEPGLLVPIDLALEANDRFAAAIGKEQLEVGGVSFHLPSGERDHVSLHKARWSEWAQDPPDFYENYDWGPAQLHDPRMPFLRVPNADYVAAHVLAVAEDDPQFTNNFTMRVGRYGWGHGQVLQYDFAAQAPRRSEAAKIEPSRVIQTPAGPLCHVRVDWPEAFAQDIEDYLEIELTKEIRLARRSPDPCRFRTRPLGLPSGVRIAALTLERSPLQMRVASSETGHVFVQPQAPEFKVQLKNITAAPQAYTLTCRADHFYGEKAEVIKQGSVPAGETGEVAFSFDKPRRGHHELTVTLADGNGRRLLTRRTSFALLPPDTRQYRESAPWGTWDFGATHYGNPNTEINAALASKLGLRWVPGGTTELRAKYHLGRGSEPVVTGAGGIKVYEDAVRDHADQVRVGLLFHEGAISYEHILRIPDIFTDRPAYVLNETEKKQYQLMWDQATGAAKEFRTKFPADKLSLGNGAMPLREEFYRSKFPAELFDYAGNEMPSFGRPPEAQPPDPIANNASLWMDRQMLDHYGYKDKVVQQCYEAGYVATNPGNVALDVQADYYVRHALHALAWNLPYIRYAMLADVGNSYYFSNWGATGFCNRHPEMNPKPSYVAFATLTLMMDGAKFVCEVPTPSPSVYVLEFEKRDQSRVWALWTLHGRRPVTLKLQAGEWRELVNDQGEFTPVQSTGGETALTLTPSVVYLTGTGTISDVRATAPTHEERPAQGAKVISSLASTDEWTVEAERDPVLEFYGMMQPRRKGDFEFAAAAEFEGQKGVMRVTPRAIKVGKDTMPMYTAVAHKQGIKIDGVPTSLGLWVNGNSSQGRVIFELEDASGQRWTNIGAPSADPNPPYWLEKIVPAELRPRFKPMKLADWNTEDVFGISRIDFDGWRWIEFPLPGHYPGEGYVWPINSQWRWDKDGKVHYPLSFRRLIVELPEKTLHVRTFAPAPRPEIYLKDLSVSYGGDPTK